MSKLSCQPRLLVTALILFCCFSVSAQQKARPNIIYIMTDDMGYADLSCYGQKNYTTPMLDKLCSQGMKFENAYAAAPVCTPTRVAFMTGRYPARLEAGLYEPIAEGPKDSSVGLTPATPSIATLLKKASYETFLVGKWHLGYQPAYSPNRNGFDYFYGCHAGAMDYISHSNDLYENEKAIEQPGYATDLWADMAVEIIHKHHSKPFFLAVMFTAPHWPWQIRGDSPYPPGIPNWTRGGSKEVYVSMMKSLDSAIGKIVDAVDSHGLSENTVIIFTNDNGGERYSDNGIYKGAKMSLWEGGIRTPAFVRWTGKINAASKSAQVCHTMDFTATILSLAGAQPDSRFPLDGMDLTRVLLTQQKAVDRTMYWRIFQRKQHKAIRDGKWKWVQDEKGNEYLFDLSADPGEKENLKEKNSNQYQKLKQKYQRWESAMLKPIPLGA